MAVELSSYCSSEAELIMVIDFLTRFLRKASIQEMPEAQALVALSSSIKGLAISTSAGNTPSCQESAPLSPISVLYPKDQ